MNQDRIHHIWIIDDEKVCLKIETSVAMKIPDGIIHAYSDPILALNDITTLTPPIDLLLLDNVMPKMDGPSFLRKFKQLPAYQNTPIIMISSKAMQMDIQQAYLIGIDDYIIKPVNYDDILKKIEFFLKKRGSRI